MKIFYLILVSIAFSSVSNYDVSMCGGNVAKVSIHSKNILINDSLVVRKIQYQSSSQSVVDFFYPVSNFHETIIYNNSILKYKKNINQADYKEKTATYRQNDTTFYNPETFICKNCHNIFSLLDLAEQNYQTVLGKEYIIDRDGERFKANFHLKSQLDNIVILELNIKPIRNQNYLNRKNDIFLWGLFLPNCKRLISIDINNNNIIKCQFINQLGSLEAVLIK